MQARVREAPAPRLASELTALHALQHRHTIERLAKLARPPERCQAGAMKRLTTRHAL
jgi:hypothetical protein